MKTKEMLREQLKRIQEKLTQLKRVDQDYSLFGSEKHHYKLNPVLEEGALSTFETNYGVILPTEYKLFLTTLGNGGAGPFYGLEPFEHGLFA